MASKNVVQGRGSKRQWDDVEIRADLMIRTEAVAEGAEANGEGTEVSLGLWERVRRFWTKKDRV